MTPCLARSRGGPLIDPERSMTKATSTGGRFRREETAGTAIETTSQVSPRPVATAGRSQRVLTVMLRCFAMVAILSARCAGNGLPGVRPMPERVRLVLVVNACGYLRFEHPFCPLDEPVDLV